MHPRAHTIVSGTCSFPKCVTIPNNFVTLGQMIGCT